MSAEIDRDSLSFAATVLRNCVEGAEDDTEVAEWFNPSFLLDVAEMLDACSNALHGKPAPSLASPSRAEDERR